MVLEIIGICLGVTIIAITVNIIDKNRKISNTKISFKESMDLTELPVVTFYSDGKKINFLLDTGSNLSHINSHILSNLKYEIVDKSMDTIGMEGNKVTTNFCKISIYYKNQKFEEEFSITDLKNAFETVKQDSGVQIHGILGSKFFEKYKYVLDFKNLIAYMK